MPLLGMNLICSTDPSGHDVCSRWNGPAVKPLLVEAFIPTIFVNPSVFRCSLRFIISNTDLKSKSQLVFELRHGYFKKWGIITLVKSVIEYTI